MRDLLTYIGIALIVALSAVFAAPFLLDFDAFRPRIAEELTQATGAQTRLDGPIALRFLPTPRFSAENLEVSGDFGSLRAKKAVFALSLPALLGGRLQFSRALLDGADIVIDADKAGRRALVAAQFDNLSLRRAHVTILRGGAPAIEIAGLDATAQIASLQGPFTGRGAFDWRGQKIAFSLAADVVAKNLLPVKASLTAPGDAGKLDLDGRIDLARAPAFEGDAKAAGKAAPGPWTAQGAVLLKLDGALVKEFSARLGDGPLADKLSGGGRYESAGGKLVLAVEAPTLSGRWAQFFAAPLLAMDSAALFDLRLGAGSLDWRGATWTGAQFVWRTGAPARIKALGPGATQVEISAAPDTSGWHGKAQLKTADFSSFAAALRDAAPKIGKALAGVELHALDLGGDFAATPAEWALTNASLALDRARFSGDIRIRPETPDAKPMLMARLFAPALDLDAVPDMAGAPFDGIDLDLALEAQTVRFARGGLSSGDGGRIKAHLLRSGEATRLERLEMHNIIGGADLTASAAWGRDFSGLQGEARLKAGDLAPLAQALARVLPGAATRAAAARAKSLSPADLAGKAGDGGFSLSGTLGATKIAASLLPAAGVPRVVLVDLAAPEAGALLNQFGAQTVWGQRLGAARVSARAQPDPTHQGAQIVTASADVAGLRGEFHGALADPAISGDAMLAGDVGKILGAFSGTPAAPVPVRLAARATWRDGVLSFQDIGGEWAGGKVAGELAADATGVNGALRCDRLSAPAIAALVLGPPAPVKAGALWPSLSFAPLMFDPPRATLAIETGDLQPLGAKARFNLALGPGALSVAGAELEVLGGVLRGGFDLRRDGAQISLSGEAEGQNIALKNPAMSALLDGQLKFAGGGANVAALIGSLAGEGAARLRDLVVAGAASAAPDQALAAAETNEAPFDAKAVAKSLDAAFAREALRRTEANFNLRLARGQAALAPADESGQGLEAGFDMRDATMSLAFSAAAQNPPPGWSGPPPRGTVVWSGPWRAPVRQVDANGFVDAVATRALEREQARIEQLKRQDQERLRALSAQPVQPTMPEAAPER